MTLHRSDPPMPPPPAVVVLRRALTPAQARVLHLIAEAPSYEQLAVALGVAPRTVAMHVLDIADLLPSDFVPNGRPKERVILYAIRVYALAQAARARENEA